eukprot:TRINITY_DN8365_c0_g3_i1.p1 TRINITY_DN8365_c0_g3~~TRINITY_DN8365_c0_g3_i1.p1  ORF type:complete len:104 (+),score=21.62 TRINITY_DN8365_c0_g3_i1:1-312(+)
MLHPCLDVYLSDAEGHDDYEEEAPNGQKGGLQEKDHKKKKKEGSRRRKQTGKATSKGGFEKPTGAFFPFSASAGSAEDLLGFVNFQHPRHLLLDFYFWHVQFG